MSDRRGDDKLQWSELKEDALSLSRILDRKFVKCIHVMRLSEKWTTASLDLLALHQIGNVSWQTGAPLWRRKCQWKMRSQVMATEMLTIQPGYGQNVSGEITSNIPRELKGRVINFVPSRAVGQVANGVLNASQTA